jgi:PIN domain nuclease of toxin-antitoxin system
VPLLDTHALLWWLADDGRLPPGARRAIKDPAAIAYVSAGSVWEIAIKRSLGKLELPDSWYAATFRDFAELPITSDHARRAGELPPHHRDPFDRILVAQALAEGLMLVTADPAFARYGVQVTW